MRSKANESPKNWSDLTTTILLNDEAVRHSYVRVELPFYDLPLKLKTRLCPKCPNFCNVYSPWMRGIIIRSGYKWIIQGNLCKGNLLSVLHEAVSSLIFTSLTDHLYDGCYCRLSWSKETGYQAPTKNGRGWGFEQELAAFYLRKDWKPIRIKQQSRF